MSEKSEQNLALQDLSALDKGMFWRNNTGQAWQGTRVEKEIGAYVKIEPGMVVLARSRVIRFGLPGSSDILGAYDGRPVAVEMKDKTDQRELQGYFEEAWTKAGGIYVLAHTRQEAVAGVVLA